MSISLYVDISQVSYTADICPVNGSSVNAVWSTGIMVLGMVLTKLARMETPQAQFLAEFLRWETP